MLRQSTSIYLTFTSLPPQPTWLLPRSTSLPTSTTSFLPHFYLTPTSINLICTPLLHQPISTYLNLLHFYIMLPRPTSIYFYIPLFCFSHTSFLPQPTSFLPHFNLVSFAPTCSTYLWSWSNVTSLFPSILSILYFGPPFSFIMRPFLPFQKRCS